MVDVVVQSLLLPKDMADLRSMRQHKVFLGLKRDLAKVSLFLSSFLSLSLSLSLSLLNCTSLPFQAIQATFKAEEMVNYSHRKLKEEEGRQIAALNAFHMAEKSNQELKSKLIEEERERKSAATALDSAKRKIKGQHVLLHNVEDQLATSKKHTIALKFFFGGGRKKPRIKQRRPGKRQRKLGRRPSSKGMT